MQEQGLRFLIPYMQPYRKMLLLGTLYAFIGAAASAFSPTLLGWGVDSLTDGVQLRVLGLFALGLVMLSATLALFRYLLRMLTGRIAAGVTYSMSAELFHRLLLFDKETREKYGTGDLLSRATSDFIYIWRFYSAGFQMSMHSLFLLLIGCVLMSLTSPALAITVVLMLAGSIVIQIRLGRILERSFSGVQEQMAEISAFVADHLGAAHMLTAYAQEKAVGKAFKQANDDYVEQNLNFILRSALISRIPRFVVQMASTLIVVVGGLLIIGDELTVGQYVQFIFYLTLLNSAAMQLTGAFERLQQGSAAAGRIGEVLHKWPRIRNKKNAQSLELQGQLSFENAGVWAEDQERWVLRNINLKINAGTTVGIVGPTGAGKSMLIGLLGRIHDPDEGVVRVDGHDLRDLKLSALRNNITYVPQQNLLFSMTLRNNIALGVPETPEPRIWRAIDQSRLSNDLEQLPKGLESIVGERGATLSGGQRQRTAIARALVRKPKVLLLDDALASVDMKTSAEIIRELREERDRRTCIIVSQRMAAVQDADQIIVLDHGSIVEQGSHTELLAGEGLYAEMYHREVEQSEVEQSEVEQSASELNETAQSEAEEGEE